MAEKFGLVIIQSLGGMDKPTGQMLRQGLMKFKQFQEPNLSCDYHDVQQKDQLIQVLQELSAEITEAKFYPVLHLEAHGSEDGLQLGSGEYVSWSEIVPLFREMNEKLENYLLLCFGTCFGGSIITLTDPNLRAPFRGVVAPLDVVTEREVLIGFEAFYDHLYFSFEVLEAVDRMNNAIAAPSPTFYHMSAQYLFEQFCNPDRDPKGLRYNAERMAAIQKRTNPSLRDVSLSDLTDQIEKDIRQMLVEASANRDFFLMNDLNPGKSG